MVPWLARLALASPCTGPACDEQRCAEGVAPACAEAGSRSWYGAGVPTDRDEAVRAWTRGCELGDATSCGFAAALGRWGEGDLAADEDAWRRANRGCFLRDGRSCWWLGTFRAHGRGVDADPRGAIDAFERSCRAGWAWGCRSLADALETWTDVPPDPTRAVGALERGCTLGDPWACDRRARRSAVGDGVPRDLRAARAWLRESGSARLPGSGPRDLRLGCSLGDPDACDGLADAVPALAGPLGREAELLRAPDRPPGAPADGAVDEALRACFRGAVDRLAGPDTLGRASGSAGYDRAADVLAELLAPLPAARWRFEGTVARAATTAVLRLDGEAARRFAPLPWSGEGAFDGAVVSLGCAAPERRVKAPIVRYAGCDAAELYELARAAVRHGAVAVLWSAGVRAHAPEGGVPLVDWSLWERLPVPVLAVDGDVEPSTASGELALADVTAGLANVVAIVPGRGALAEETVLVGAHLDHLGADPLGRVRWGADDNASGVAALACAAPRITAGLAEQESHRAVALVAFDGEELGFLGSAAYAAREPLPVAVVNLDMVGHLGSRALGVGGLASGPWRERLDPAARAAGLAVVADTTAPGASDHVAFLERGVPAVHLFTGTHRAYHDPHDRPATVDVDGGSRVTALTADLAVALAIGPRMPPSEGCGGEGDARLGLGLRWVGGVGPGVEVTCVDPGLGEDLGVRPGDHVVAVGGAPVASGHGLLQALDDGWPFRELGLVVLRDGVEIALPAIEAGDRASGADRR